MRRGEGRSLWQALERREAGGSPGRGAVMQWGVHCAWHWVAILLPGLDHLLGEGSSWYSRRKTETGYQVLAISGDVLQRQV